MDTAILERLNACEHANRRLTRLLSMQAVALVALGTTLVGSCATTAQPPVAAALPTTLRVSELVVVDSNGVERVRIGGHLPDALIGGRRVPRGEKAAGVLLYDGTGQERSGYVTFEPSGNVGLTLDTRQQQVAYFVAGRESGSALQLWYGRDVVELRSDQDGSRVTAVRGGEVVAQQPVVEAMSPGTCAAYQEAKTRVSQEQVVRDCRRRFGDAACRACLE